MNKCLLLATVFLAFNSFAKLNNEVHNTLQVHIPVGGNTWASGDKTGGRITNKGIENWSNTKTTFTTYVRVNNKGSLKVWVNVEVPNGKKQN